MNAFEKINDWMRNTESSVVNLIAAIAPWLAPLAPAYMTYNHALNTLKFPNWIALPGAVTVEILGFSTVSTFLAFWFHNRRNQAEVKKAPISVVVFAFAFYLTLILVSNVLLDTFDNAKWAVITVRALFTLQSIPAALLVAVRTQHRDLLNSIDKEKREKNERTSDRTVSGSAEKKTDSDRDVTGQRKQKSELTGQDWRKIAVMSSTDISSAYGCDERTARRWRKDAQERTTPPFP